MSDEKLKQIGLSFATKFRERERRIVIDGALLGHERIAKMFKWSGGIPPYGYVLDDDNYLEVDPDEAFVVRRIFEIYIELMSIRKVADVLNLNGIPTKQDSYFGESKISVMLNNPIYMGNLQRKSNIKYFSSLQLISNELYEKVQKIKEMNPFEKRSYNKIRNIDLSRFKIYLSCPLQCNDICDISKRFTYEMKNSAETSSFICRDCRTIACIYCAYPEYSLCLDCSDKRLRAPQGEDEDD